MDDVARGGGVDGGEDEGSAGRRVGVEEVGALEGIVGAVGRGEEGDVRMEG